MSEPAPQQGSSGIVAAFTLLFVYCCITPGLAAMFFLMTHGQVRANEFIAFAYMLGAPIGLVVAVVHWFLRKWSAWTAAPLVIATGTLGAAAAGPMAMICGGLAYILTVPPAHAWARQQSDTSAK